MNKILLVIQREYLTRIKKKSFLIMTILGPLLMGGIFAATFLLDKVDNEVKTIVVIDETGLFKGKFKSNERIHFEDSDLPLPVAKQSTKEKGYFGILYIPVAKYPQDLEKRVTIYSGSQPGFEVISKIKFTLEKEINTSKYIAAGIDEKKLSEIKTDVQIRTRDLEDKETSTPVTTVLGFGGGLLIYLFIFIYGAMVMRGVLEEKTSRIVEVIISSIRPFQLMMGKIIGVALVGLTQFLLWVILSSVVYGAVSSWSGKDVTQQDMLQKMMEEKSGSKENYVLERDAHAADEIQKKPSLSEMMASINFPLLIGMFIFYFLGGYLLYSALFAAIGAAVDSETDTQQFMLPVTIPLIIAYIAAVNVMQNPQGNVAFWFSIIPFTSPIVMMVRIPFGVPWQDVVLSMGLLIAGFIFTTWVAGKIYRVGILMYGKKVSYRELWRWLRYS